MIPSLNKEVAMCAKTCLVQTEVGKIICHCFGVDEPALIEITRLKGITNLSELRQETEAGSGCTACHHKLKKIIQDNQITEG